MKYLILLLILIYIPSAFSQRDLATLQGNFVACEAVELMGLHSQNVRPHRFTCQKARGFVLEETPVKKISVVAECGNKKATFDIQTQKDCNTVGCLYRQAELKKIVERVSPNLKKSDCLYQIKKANLFEYYPMFSTSGPNKKEPFLDTMTINNEDDPDYQSRINGHFQASGDHVVFHDVNTPSIKEERKPAVSKDSQEEICRLGSLEVLTKSEQDKFIKIIKELYQNPKYNDDKLQRKSFCLLKGHYEAVGDYDALLDLIAKMKFEQEMCN